MEWGQIQKSCFCDACELCNCAVLESITNSLVNSNEHRNKQYAGNETFKIQKTPVNKLVRVDSSNPAGRLHAFLQNKVANSMDDDNEVIVIR